MKQLICEMCGGTDLIKNEGVFVCQYCGAKYSVEDAKKMMVEGTVDVSGSTVKVDNNDRLNNLYQIARRARDDNNSENAARYYEMILVDDPNSWEASFYAVYFRAMSCKIAYIKSAAISVSNCLDGVFVLIKNNEPHDNQKACVQEVYTRSLFISKMLFSAATSHFKGIGESIRYNYIGEYVDNIISAKNIVLTCGNGIDVVFSDRTDIAYMAGEAWKAGINMQYDILKSTNRNFSVGDYDKEIQTYSEKISKYDQLYYKEYYKAILERRIQILKNQYQVVNSDVSISKEGSRASGIVFLVIGIVLVFLKWILIGIRKLFWNLDLYSICRKMDRNGLSNTSTIFSILIGIVVLTIGVVIMIISSNSKNKNVLNVEKQKKMNDLMKEINSNEETLSRINEQIANLRGGYYS